MDGHGQGEVNGISPAYASPQSNFSDTKHGLEGSTLQDLTQGLGKKGATFEVTVRPKPSGGPDLGLPLYAEASKSSQSLPLRTRQSARSSKFFNVASKPFEGRRAKTSKSSGASRAGTSKQPFGDEEVVKSTVRPQVTCIPSAMFTFKTPPTEKDPFFFIGFVKGYRSLDYLYYIHGRKPAFLELPIASGDWSGVWVHVATLNGGTRKEEQLLGKVTWGEIMHFLHALHPTGTHFDVIEEEDEFFDVAFSLCYSSM